MFEFELDESLFKLAVKRPHFEPLFQLLLAGLFLCPIIAAVMRCMGLYCVMGIGIYPAYIMPVVGRSVVLWAVCLASCIHARRVRESVKPSGVAVV